MKDRVFTVGDMLDALESNAWDALYHHPMFSRVWMVWTRALIDSCSRNTGGVVTLADLRRLCPVQWKKARKAADLLVEFGLFELHKDGYRVLVPPKAEGK